MIEKGDTVNVYFEYADAIFDAKVDYIPCATGDLWHLLSEDGQDIYVMNFSSMHKMSNHEN